MAKTFTGLKLQGDIGKFGKVELSDVVDFAELPDGKVLSSSENSRKRLSWCWIKLLALHRAIL